MGNSAVASQETDLSAQVLDSTQALRAECPELSAQPDLAAVMFYNEMKIEMRKKKVCKKKTVNQSPVQDILLGIEEAV